MAILILMISVSIIAGYGEALRIKDVTGNSALWHWMQLFERAGIFATGIYIFNIYQCILFISIFWTVYDGLINRMALNKSFFYISPTSKAVTEKFGYLKIPFLIIAIIFMIIHGV